MAPTGLARRQLKGIRFSSGRLSGRMNRPYRKATPDRAPATQKGTRGPNSPRKPPRTGPSTNPPEKAAPIRP
ncbi:hypothetical protein D9M72_621410 [compost metagenome]